MSSKNVAYLGFNDFWFMLIGIPVIGFFMPIFFYEKTLAVGFFPYLKDWAQGTMFSTTYWIGSRAIYIMMRKRYPDFEDSMKRIILQTLVTVAFVTIAGPLVYWLSYPFWMHLGNPEDPSIAGTVGTYGIVLLMTTIYEAIYIYAQLKKSIQEKEQAVQAQLRSELEGLRNQVNPHFLFNSLNTLMNIVAEDQKLAISFLKKLSKVYRYVLESRGEQLITLSDEMNFMEAYIFLQKERFQKNLQIEINIDEQYHQFYIVPLALQILFENAIKHNIVSSKKPLNIKLYSRENFLVVENNLQRKRTVSEGTKVGLNNVRTRYKIFTNKEVAIQETDTTFRVTIPLLNN
ncbi:MAG: histidine kinase [Bacteroidota bacterium]